MRSPEVGDHMAAEHDKAAEEKMREEFTKIFGRKNGAMADWWLERVREAEARGYKLGKGELN